jgi:cell division protein FtsL
MKPIVIHDLKTERPDVGQPLPGALRALPVLFFAAILGAIGFSAYAFWQKKLVEKEEGELRQDETAQMTEQQRLKLEDETIRKEIANANEVREWLQSTNQMQGMVTTISRAMTAESTISQLTLARRDEMNSQIQMALQINASHGQQQVDQLRTAVSDLLGYRSFSEAIDTKGNRTELSFDCTWIKIDSTDNLNK